MPYLDKIRLSIIVSLFLFFPSLALAQSVDGASAGKRIVSITNNIEENKILRAKYNYFIDGEIHVLSGVTLKIEDGVTVLVRNGKINGALLNRSALIFDTGSKLEARKVYFKAAGASKHEEKIADNAGIWFLGSYRDAEKDGVSVVVEPWSQPSHFSASTIVTSYLGHGDPDIANKSIGVKKDDSDVDDDVDGFSVLGVGNSEWDIKAVRSEFSGDDGFDVTNSRIDIEDLSIRNPTEDGMNISSSRVEIVKSLKIAMTNSIAPDRDLFDLEVDDGPSYIVLHRGCEVKVFGVFGDEVILKSSDLPQPNPCNCKFYEFDGVSKKAAAIIFSKTED